jgi:hypothetical protein
MECNISAIRLVGWDSESVAGPVRDSDSQREENLRWPGEKQSESEMYEIFKLCRG